MINPCSFCRAECCKTYTITATVFDILRIASRTNNNPEDVAVLHEPRLLSYDPDMVLDTTDGYGYYLLGIGSHPCAYLDKQNRCSIHDSAPLSCRRFPRTLGKNLNLRFCPLPSQLLFRIKRADIGADQVIAELEGHKKLVKAWNKKKGTKKECLEFLVEKATAGLK
jgi:Fe-S-cluster containining protein